MTTPRDGGAAARDDDADAVSRATCACGGLAITVVGQPELHGVCHCTNCKRRTGSAFGISAYFARDAVLGIDGNPRVWSFEHSSGTHRQDRHFCGTCGTMLFWFVSTMPQRIGIAAGCFANDDDRGLLGALRDPDGSHRDAKRLPWVTLPGAWVCTG